MKTITVNVYKFHELSLDAQRRVLEKLFEQPWIGEFTLEDSRKSLKAYCEYFDVELLDYRIGAYCHNWVKTNADNSHFRGLKLKNCDPDYMPTGFCIDYDFFHSFYEEFKRTGDAKAAFEYGLDQGLGAIEGAMEYEYSEENLINLIDANEYEFDSNGNII